MVKDNCFLKNSRAKILMKLEKVNWQFFESLNRLLNYPMEVSLNPRSVLNDYSIINISGQIQMSLVGHLSMS